MGVRRALRKRIALLEFILARYDDEDDPAMRNALVGVVRELRALRKDLATCEKLAAAKQQTPEFEDRGTKGR